jgi:hypothetical protein
VKEAGNGSALGARNPEVAGSSVKNDFELELRVRYALELYAKTYLLRRVTQFYLSEILSIHEV